MPRLLSRASVVRFFRPLSSVSSTGHLQPHLDQMQHVPIYASGARQRLHEFVMGDASEVVREVGVYHFRVITEQLLFHLHHRLLGMAPLAVGVLFWRQVSFEDRF